MKKIIVKVTHKETEKGLPNLLVVAYSANSKLEKLIQGNCSSPTEISASLRDSKRIGSILTDPEGLVQLTLQEEESKTSKVNNPDKPEYPETKPKSSDKLNLVVTVQAPEGQGKSIESRLLYVSTEVRKHAGYVETIHIELTTKELINAEISVPAASSTNGKPEAEEAVREQFKQRLNKVILGKFQTEKIKVKDFDVKFKEVISKVNKKGGNVLGENEDLDEMQNRVFTRKLVEVNEQPVNAEGIILLTNGQKELLTPFLSQDGGSYENVPNNIIDPILYPSEKDKRKPSFLLRENTVAEYCRQKSTDEKCSEKSLTDNELVEVEEQPVPEENESTGLTSDEIPKYLKNLVNLQSSPEEKIFFGEVQSSRRATQADIQESINSFVLDKGPADSVSYFDFHNLQIAFEHIWMEAIDKDVLDLARNAYSIIVDLIGDDIDPSESMHDPAILTLYGTYFLIAYDKPIPATVVAHFEITQANWNNLPYGLQAKLEEIANKLDKPIYVLEVSAGPVKIKKKTQMTSKDIFRLRQQGERIVAFVQEDSYRSLHKILHDLNKKLTEKYAFTIFPVKNNGQRSINFGTVVTYRQKWEPLNYQAGELVKTITLTPKEERKVSYVQKEHKKRSVKERNKHSSIHREESNTTSRAEAEIVKKAMIKTNFNLSAEGSQDFLLSDGKYKTGFTRDAQNDSQETKKEFREAVRKASHEYKSERSIEIDTEETFETEFNQSATIVNPNDELGLTCLFYELQRRFRVSEEIHRLTPIILVAQEVPAPNEIDEDWLIRHDWILRRVILDDSFVPSLNYLSTNIVGDEYALKELKKGLTLQRQLVAELKQEAVELQQQVDNRYAALENAVAARINEEEDEETDSWFSNIAEFFGADEESPEAAKAREQAAQDAHEHAVSQAKHMASKLQREITALNASTEKYTKKLGMHLNRKTQIERLKIHIKDNIFYYMQAIWTHEPSDQRFFRLYNTMVPHFEIEQKNYTIQVNESKAVWTGIEAGSTAHQFHLNSNIKSNLVFKKLIEVADLDNLLGFKGNYMIFPLIEPNALTQFMMAPYIDVAFGLRDPDEFGNMNLQDFSKYICCLKEEMSDEEFKAIKPVLKEYYGQLLKSPLRNGEDILVATDSLFIELLPSIFSVLEEFKLMHRAIDVKKVQAEVREMELENIRLAARLLAGEREDPDIDKKIVIEGNSNTSISADDN